MAGLLKQYADKYQLAVVVTNQVSAQLINACLLAEMRKPLPSILSLNFMLNFFMLNLICMGAAPCKQVWQGLPTASC